MFWVLAFEDQQFCLEHNDYGIIMATIYSTYFIGVNEFTRRQLPLWLRDIYLKHFLKSIQLL